MHVDKEKLAKLHDEVNAKAEEILQYKSCGFEDKPCGRKCIYYNTCTRNPYRYDQKGAQP